MDDKFLGSLPVNWPKLLQRFYHLFDVYISGMSFYIISATKKLDIIFVFYINLIPLSRRKYADVTGRDRLAHHRNIRTAINKINI